MSNKQIEAMKLALKALENSYDLRDDIIDAKEALREALAQSRSDEEQSRSQSPDGGGTLAQQSAERGEPVAEYIGECSDGSLVQLYDDIKKGAKLYAAPQAQPRGEATLAREPLPYDKNDMEGLDAHQRLAFKLGWKSAEAAHGITGSKT